MPPPDRRRHPRFPLQTRATLKVGDFGYSGFLRNISRRGGLFVTDISIDFAPADFCRVVARHPDLRKVMTLSGIIVCCREHFIGIQLSPVDQFAELPLRSHRWQSIAVDDYSGGTLRS